MKTKYALARVYIYGLDWTEWGDDNQSEIIVYDTYEEAEQSLEDYVEDIHSAFSRGYLTRDFDGDIEIIKITVDENGMASHPDIEDTIKIYNHD